MGVMPDYVFDGKGLRIDGVTDGKPAAAAGLKTSEEKLANLPEGSRFTSDCVTSNDIAAVVSKWTGIPLQKMMQSEREKLLLLEDELGKRVIGQKEAVRAVSDADVHALRRDAALEGGAAERERHRGGRIQRGDRVDLGRSRLRGRQ